MTKKEKGKSFKTVFVTGFFETRGIYEDQVVAVGDDRYRSIKYRRTYYSSSDFHENRKVAEQFILGMQIACVVGPHKKVCI